MTTKSRALTFLRFQSERHNAPFKKEIAAAIEYARSKGWRVVEGGSHAWGQMYCPHNDKECRCGEFCRTSIWSTPKSPGNHAKQLPVDNCSANRPREPIDDEEQP